MTTVWLARTGEGGYALHDCIAHDLVALRYYTVPDASELSQAEIAEHLKKAPTVSDHTGVAGMLVRFVHDVRDGDLVITPHAKERRAFFGRVTGSYRYEAPDDAPVKTLLHMRGVEWLGAIDRDTIPKPRRIEIDQRRTFYAVISTDYWLTRAEESTALKLRPPAKALPPEAAKNAVAAIPPKCAVCNITISVAEAEVGLCDDCLSD
jgi:predicted Mrr-cat superfamily restriction endonuclease